MRDEFVDFNPQIPFLRQAETYRSEHVKRDLLYALCDGRLGHRVLLRGGGHSAWKRVVQNNCDDDQQAPEHERILSA
jgi:hypothetical protein